MSRAGFSIDAKDGTRTLRLSGDWTADQLGPCMSRLRTALQRQMVDAVNWHAVGRLDTAGAYALLRALGPNAPEDFFADRPEARQVVDLVIKAKGSRAWNVKKRPKGDLVTRTLQKLGRGTMDVVNEIGGQLAFFGAVVSTLLRSLMAPHKIRYAALFSLAERAGLDALPIIITTNFFVGAVVAFLSADQLLQFGAAVFTVEMIGVSVTREFAVLITSVLLAGRSASSFAAEIGAMKMNQEVNAMRVMGVDPFEALVLPRMLALILLSPLLVFAGILAGLGGGLLVAWVKLDLTPAFFLQRMVANVSFDHFIVGMIKTPVFAAVVASIGCRMGLTVTGDVETLGRKVTSAVVQAIFAIIFLDAVFALIFLELGM
ncbi:MAG: MlaE family lipid ABC transporter permease subunit [Asticcacaulis sp.]